MTFLYKSTRGRSAELDFKGVTLTGLADDGGLFVPCQWPHFSEADIVAMRGLSYQEIAFRVMKPFVQGALPEADLRHLIESAYKNFDHPEITPLTRFAEDAYLLDLFHGPTYAFKDVALQFLGQVFDYFLAQSGEKMTVLGATSGDTGSAAMEAVAGRQNIDAVILFPQGRPSEIQQRQMTCIEAPNVQAVAIEGTFDDCQSIVKALFNDAAFKKEHRLTAVNSINWARILAQIVYYFVAAVRLGAPDVAPSFVVPTGNFGNIFAAYAAMRCGLPVSKLAVATNSNDILTRFFASGAMEPHGVAQTLSPSMDIQISSNFERLLFDLCQRDAAQLSAYMAALDSDKHFEVSKLQLGMARQYFTAAAVSNEETLQMIAEAYKGTNLVLDPHTAVGVKAAQKLRNELPKPVVMLACAHPAKFPLIIQRAINHNISLPEKLLQLLQKPERSLILPADIQAVKGFLSSRVTHGARAEGG